MLGVILGVCWVNFGSTPGLLWKCPEGYFWGPMGLLLGNLGDTSGLPLGHLESNSGHFGNNQGVTLAVPQDHFGDTLELLCGYP